MSVQAEGSPAACLSPLHHSYLLPFFESRRLEKRRYAKLILFRRHDGSMCTQKQPKTVKKTIPCHICAAACGGAVQV